jgi:protein-tyrosine-phosphatase/predicted ATP-grasp superfamily ATP-dependent carboligase
LDTPSRSVLITDAHELAGLGAVRSLGRAGHRVTVAHPRRPELCASRGSRYVAARLTSPDPWQDQPAFRAWLMDQARSGRYDAILPISEAAIVAASAVRARLGPGPAWLMPDDRALGFALSKVQATQAAARAGLLVPRTVVPGAGPAAQELAGLRFPLILKRDNRLLADGRYEKGAAACVHDLAQAEVILRAWEGASLLAQEHVPGHGAGVFLLRFDGTTHLRFCHRRLHEVPYTGGFSSLRESCHDDALVAQAEALLSAIDYAGAAMVEFRRGPDGAAWFLEINGRLWGSLALCLHAGADFPLALLECHLFGRPRRPQPPYADGIRCRNVVPGELLHLQSILRARGTDPARPGAARPLWEFVRLSLDPMVRHDHLWLADPGPALVQALNLGRRGLRQVRRLADGARDRLLLWREQRAHPTRLRRVLSRPVRRVLFLCYGNICRSPFAAACFNRRVAGRGGLRADSAGFYEPSGRPTPPPHRGIVRALGVDLAEHRSQVVNPELLHDADLIVAMDLHNLRALRRRFPEAAARTFLLGLFAPDGPALVRDPFWLEAGEARQVYEELAAAVEGLVSTISTT